MKARVPLFLWFMLFALLAGYFIQMCTPLRLNSDAVLCLAMADQAIDSGTWVAWYNREISNRAVAFPGYPTVVAMLTRLGLGQSWGLVLLNQIFLWIGTWSAAVVAIGWGLSSRQAVVISLATLLSWVMVKHASLPLTELMFYGLSMSSVMLAQKAARREQGTNWQWQLVAAAVLAALAICTRVVGVALIPAVATALILPKDKASRAVDWLLKHWIIVAGIAIVICVAAVATMWLSTDTAYGIEFAKRHRELGSGSQAIVSQLKMRIADMGLLGLNIPSSVIYDQFGLAIYLAGGLFAAMLFVGIRSLRTRIDPALVFLGTYLAILALWPFADPRFMLPVLPHCITCIMLAWNAMKPGVPYARALKLAGGTYAAVYAALGITSLVMTTRVTFSGNEFPRIYNRGGNLEASYQAAWGQDHDPSRARPQVVEILRRHERRD